MTRHPSALILLATVAMATACVGSFAAPVPRVIVPGEPIAFEAVQTGNLHRRSLELANPGTASARVTLRAEPPFSMSTDAIALAPGSVASVTVLFRSTGFEPADGAVTVNGPGGVQQVALTGTIATDWDQDGFDDVAAGGTDCDDVRATVAPGLDETCDGVDNDCDGDVDNEAVDAEPWFRDEDNDGFGVEDDVVLSCAPPTGYVADAGDCDDANGAVRPGARERTNSADDDCDSLIDEHLLVAGSLVVTELHLDPVDVPGFVELRVRSPGTLHLTGVTLELGPTTTVLDELVVSEGDLVVLCDGPAPVGGRCDGRLTAPVDGAERFTLRAEGLIDEVNASEWSVPTGRSLELDPAQDHRGNDAEDAWCPSDTPLGNSDLCTPGSEVGHCSVGA